MKALMAGLKQLSLAVMCALLGAFWTGTQSLAEEVPVCGISRDEFVEVALPEGDITKTFNGKLLKYARPPGLAVLVPQGRPAIGKQAETIFDAIKRDNLVKPFRSSFVMYRSFEEAQRFIEQLGNENIFVLVAEEPNKPLEAEKFRSALRSILFWPERVESLIARSKLSRGFVSSNRMELGTGEVISTAILINPKYDDAQIGRMAYIAYYFGISPSTSSMGQSYFSRFFDESADKGVTLNVFARQFFRVFGDDRVKFGMTKESFVGCS